MASEFFATSAPDPHHWTLNLCFCVFCNVWVHLRPFHYCTKLFSYRDKLVQLMQMFMPRSGIRIFRYERTRSTQMNLNSSFVVFHNVWVHLEPFHYCTKLGQKFAELVQLMQKSMPRSGIRIFRYERTRSTPMDPKLMALCGS